MGIGAASGRADYRVVRSVLLAWIATLPLGLALGAGIYAILR